MIAFEEADGFSTSPDVYAAAIDKIWEEIVPGEATLSKFN
jgi:hypothetical protein